ncbi:MAG: hypothetical protein V1816_24180 [Pseudomonadota bacterium]
MKWKVIPRDTLASEKKTFRYEKGVLFYNPLSERKVFFVLTLAMLIYGIVVKVGLL